MEVRCIGRALINELALLSGRTPVDYCTLQEVLPWQVGQLVSCDPNRKKTLPFPNYAAGTFSRTNDTVSFNLGKLLRNAVEKYCATTNQYGDQNSKMFGSLAGGVEAKQKTSPDASGEPIFCMPA